MNDLSTVFFLESEGAIMSTYNTGTTEIPLVVVSQDSTLQDPDVGPEDMVVEVMCSDVTRPTSSDYFTIDSVTWYVKGNKGGGAALGTWRLVLTRQSRRHL